MFGNQIK